MDPVTVVISALSLAGMAFKPVADQAIKDGYAGLKALILRKFGGKEPELAQVIEQHEKRPELYTPTAERVLRNAGAGEDQELVDKATELLKSAEAAQPGVTHGLVGQINAAGGRIIVANTIHGGIKMGDEIDKPSGA